ncbi:MAG: glycosyltransferase family 4 protein [Tistlia sp.]|uniref:glycosyltransferase family 4 protein n=1 Tax=Tistlia sp. TaxID=3057121 RepID=UPI0034A28473
MIPSVVVSHPARQGFVYQLPQAAQEAGLPCRFLTGFYYKPGRWPWSLAAASPALVRKLSRRSSPALAPESVVAVSGPLPLLLNRLGGYVAGNGAHDRLAARWLRRHLPPGAIFHGSIESCLHSLRAAKAKGAMTLLEITLPPWKEAVLAAEARRLGLPAGPDRPPARLVEEVALADRVMVQSPFVSDFLVEQGVPPGKVVLLPLGADTGRFRPPAAPPPATSGLRAIYVGHISMRKGVHLLLEAWRAAALPDAELRLVGPVVDDFGLRLLADLPPGVRHLGVLGQDRLVEQLQGSDLFVFLSLMEGGPLVVLEALACGLPCLLSLPARSVVREGCEGLLVAPGDVAGTAAALRRLAADRPGRMGMAEAARLRAEQFDWSCFRGRLGGFYRGLLERGLEARDRPLDLGAQAAGPAAQTPANGPAAR